VIGILDYGCGNLRSLENALDALGMASRRVSRPSELAGLDRLILPGVGHFGHAMGELRTRNLVDAVKAFAAQNRPLLGICLGMQVLFEGSEEAPGVPGLGLVPGHCVAFADASLKMPHMGWSTLDFGERSGAAYFVHSYCLPAWNEGTPRPLLGTAWHGQLFVAAFRSGNLAGCQFHPEKSGVWGLALLKEMVTW